ncbi:hypothetical protein L1887_35373 [Cichorium endivia]|nr:hypothetical protein L1887_35373 [Cichorium endivia]
MAPSSVVVTVDKPTNISLVELDDSETSVFLEKQKTASTKQFYGVFYSKLKESSLSFHDSSKDEVKYKERIMYRFIRVFLAISIVALVVEIIAYFQNWDLKLIPSEAMGLVHLSYMGWISFRAEYIAPSITMLSQFCKRRNVDSGWSESQVVTLSEALESKKLHLRYVEEMLIRVTGQSFGGIPPIGVRVEESASELCGSAAYGRRRMWRRC